MQGTSPGTLWMETAPVAARGGCGGIRMISSWAPMPDQRSSARIQTAAVLLVWVLLTALQMGWLPWGRYAWAFNLWQYLPAGVAALLGALALLVCSARVRLVLLRGCSVLAGRFAALRAPLRHAVLVLGVAAFLWMVRERGFFGDSKLLLMETRSGSAWFLFPDTGATFLMWASVRLAKLLGFFPPDGVRLLACLAGAGTAWFAWQAIRSLVGASRASAVSLLVLSGGIARVFAGHVENYAVLLCAASAYLWLALACLEGRRRLIAPAAVLGVAIWLHASALFLLPSLVMLPFLRPDSNATFQRARAALGAVALAMLPSLAFLAIMALLGRRHELGEAWQLALHISGLRPDPERLYRWVRGWGSGPSVGTDVVFLSSAHLKYLVNAFYVLAPFVVPTLIAAALKRPRGWAARPEVRLLALACFPLAAYALALRPVWGPFDWDLFALTAFCHALLAGSWLAASLDEGRFRHVFLLLVGFQILFVTAPFLAAGVVTLRDAGPFAPGYFDFDLYQPLREAAPKLAPWL